MYQFLQPKMPERNSIQRKLDWTKVPIPDSGFMLPSFPPKSLREIVRLIDTKQSTDISIFEWLNAIENEEQWDALTQDERYDACRALWLQISLNTQLGDIVFFRLAQQLDDGQSRVVSDLVDTMSVARKAAHLNIEVVDKIDWLIAVQEKDWISIARFCFQKQIPLRLFLDKANLPISNQYQFAISPYLVEVAYQEYVNESELESWLLICFAAAKTTQTKIDYFESVLKLSVADHVPNQVQTLLKEHCLPFSDESYWYQLTEESRDRIKILFNLSSYYSLHGISRFLYDEENREALSIEEDDARRIRSRSLFWSNYAQQFLRIRVLLPAQTMTVYSTLHSKVPDYVCQLKETQMDAPCEVYVFEFSKIIVVEALRGSINEIRIFKNNDWHAQRLFDSPDVSLNDIRSLPQIDVHDHVIGWQYFCEKLLRTAYKQPADPNLPYFRGLPRESNSYSQTTGLPKPDAVLLSERAIQLEQWVEAFWQREFETDKYGNQSGLKRKSNVYLNKAMVEKQCGNEEQYEFFIHKAANQGNAEAMWQLGRLKLRSQKGGATSRTDGENWIRKAAKEGHREASEAVQRYKL